MPVDETLLHGWFYGNYYVRVFGAVGFALLVGSIPIGPIFAWLFASLDSRLVRSATAFVPVFGIIQGFLPSAIAVHGAGTALGLCAAFAVVASHCYSPWLKFRGGKGVAVAFGALCALAWPAGLIFGAVWLVVTVASNYTTVGSLVATAFGVVSLWFFLGPYAALYGVAVLLVVAQRHRPSFIRLSEGREATLRPLETDGRSVVRADGQPVQSFQIEDLDRAAAARGDHAALLQLE